MIVLQFFIHILALSNPLGALPVFVSVTEGMPSKLKKKIAILTGFTVSVFPVVFLFFGPVVLDFFGITVADFKIAGGLVLVFMGLKMLQGENSSVHHEKIAKDASQSLALAFVPLCMPLLAGPGVLSAVIAKADQSLDTQLLLSLSCLCLDILVGLLFAMSDKLLNYLKPMVLSVISRVMGLIIMCIAVSMIVSGVKAIF